MVVLKQDPGPEEAPSHPPPPPPPAKPGRAVQLAALVSAGDLGASMPNSCRHRAKNSLPPPTGENVALGIFISSYQNSFISTGQKPPKVLGVKCGHPGQEHTSHRGNGPSARAHRGCWGALHPQLCSVGRRCIFASDLGSSKSFLSSCLSEFPLGEEAAFGIVEQYLNTCGEKSNIRMGTERL